MQFDLVVRAAWTADGRVVAPARWSVVGGKTRELVKATPREEARAVDGVLLPGLVNAHSHHDLGGLDAHAASGSFPDWLLSIGAVRGAERDVEAAARDEARSLRESGVVLSGDVDATAGAATRGRRAAGLDGVSYLEIVGVEEERARTGLARALDHASALGGRMGLSPHAPYSVHECVLPDIVAAAREQRLPLAMHLAETPEETRFLLHGDGPFRGFLDVIGKGLPFERAPGLRPVAYAEACGLLEARGVVIHGNDLDDDDIARLARHRASVVYCHGTHRHFDRPRHRLLDLLAAGVNVALGTDSSASNAGVDLWRELRRLVADRPDVSPDIALRCATRGGRQALEADPLAADFAPRSEASAFVIGPGPDDIEGCNAADLASWALTHDRRPAICCHGGDLIRGEDTDLAGVSAFFDTVGGRG